ncbi:MAG: monofunctional biosynthetic peptidoglycan transglycosylase [Melioribacteraceae bacterium]|nr:monofunctional biosynthetic peptidoglycan transglycosylase [Melioribacteraceae bacterium]
MLMVLGIYTAVSIIIILFFRFIDISHSSFMNSASEFPEGLIINDIDYKFVSINKMSSALPLAVIASEDQAFFEHFGFDFNQIEKALKENKRRKRIRGASTISMQVAKNLFLSPSKNLFRKGLESYYTLLLELLWGKKRILEVYLNVAEMGKNTYGVGAASNKYFKREPARINFSQAALMASVLPKPSVRNLSRPSGYMIRRKAQIVQQMNQLGGNKFIKENLY